MSPSAATVRKAERLIRERRVAIVMDSRIYTLRLDPGPLVGAVAIVAGDSGRHLTTVITGHLARLAPPGQDPGPFPLCSCTCRAGQANQICSHIAALTLLIDRENEPGLHG